jgi:hypothetical protein
VLPVITPVVLARHHLIVVTNMMLMRMARPGYWMARLVVR